MVDLDVPESGRNSNQNDVAKDDPRLKMSAMPSADMNVESVLDLLDDNDAEFKHFMLRKATIMTNMTHLAA